MPWPRSETLRIGTRRSPLALWQAEWVAHRLKTEHSSLNVVIVPITTAAETMPQAHLASMGGKGLFVKEIEEALLAGTIDLAVHSLKDVPTELPPGLILVAIPPREDPRDGLILSERGSYEADHPRGTLGELPPGSKLATSSLRRTYQLRALRNDLAIIPMRGNVGTRLAKLDRGEVDAVVLAVAGLTRLGWTHRITTVFEPEVITPAIGQGALGIEAREGGEVAEWIGFLDDRVTRAAVTAERALARQLGATCRTPLGAYGRLENGAINLVGVVASSDGKRVIRETVSGPESDPVAVGRILAERLTACGGRDLLQG